MMEWLINLFNSPSSKNLSLLLKGSKVALWVAFASVIFERNKGQYHVLDIKEITPVIQFFDSGLFWLCFSYFIFSFVIYQITYAFLSLVAKWLAKLLLKKDSERNELIKEKVKNAKTRKEVYKLLYSYLLGLKMQIQPDKANEEIEKYTGFAKGFDEKAKQFCDVCVCILFLFVVMSFKHFTKPYLSTGVFISSFIALFFLSLFCFYFHNVWESIASLLREIVDNEQKEIVSQ